MIKNTLKLLIAGDVHSRTDQVFRLEKFLSSSNIRPDAIILTGDYANAKNADKQKVPSTSNSSMDKLKASIHRQLQHEASVAREETIRVFEAFRRISRHIFYIPGIGFLYSLTRGNHDVDGLFPSGFISQLFNHSPKDSNLHQILFERFNAVNLHSCLVKIKPNLILAGFGGSTSQTLKHNPKSTVFQGYPWSESDFFTGLNTLFSDKTPQKPFPIGSSKIENPPFKALDSIILVTHCGPADVGNKPLRAIIQGTTDENRQPLIEETTRIENGSYSLKSLIASQQDSVNTRENSEPSSDFSFTAVLQGKSISEKRETNSNIKKLLLNVHGHAHFSKGLSFLGKTQIVNPGPLRDGHFCIATLHYGLDASFGMASTWNNVSIEFHTL